MCVMTLGKAADRRLDDIGILFTLSRPSLDSRVRFLTPATRADIDQHLPANQGLLTLPKASQRLSTKVLEYESTNWPTDGSTRVQALLPFGKFGRACTNQAGGEKLSMVHLRGSCNLRFLDRIRRYWTVLTTSTFWKSGRSSLTSRPGERNPASMSDVDG